MKIRLTRAVGKNERYYDIEVFPTLFGDFCVEREYGSVRSKSYTGLVKSYFETLSDALLFYNKILQAKISKGYRFS